MALSKRWKLLGSLGAVVIVAIACGDDSGNKTPENPTPGPGAGGSMLSGDVAGKPCTTANQATDCGPGGICSEEQTLGTLSELLGLVGLNNTGLQAPNGYCTTGCTSDSQCGAGGVCFGNTFGLLQGECRKGCASNSDCRPEYECAKLQNLADGGAPPAAIKRLFPNQCQARPMPDKLTDRSVGTPCGEQADGGVASCASGYCAGNYCTGTCLEDSTCGAGAACLVSNAYGTIGSCQETCNVDTDCKRYTAGGNIGCIDVEGKKLCGPKVLPLEPNVVGKACTENENCGATGECADTLNRVPAPGGYCSLLGCQDDTVCGGGSCVGSRCYVTCASDTDCRSGYACQDRVNAGMTSVKVCAPAAGAPPAGGASDAGVSPGAGEADAGDAG